MKNSLRNLIFNLCFLCMIFSACETTVEVDNTTQSEDPKVRRSTEGEQKAVQVLLCKMWQEKNNLGDTYFQVYAHPCENDGSNVVRFFWVRTRAIEKTWEMISQPGPGETVIMESVTPTAEQKKQWPIAAKDAKIFLVSYLDSKPFRVACISHGKKKYWILAEPLRMPFAEMPSVIQVDNRKTTPAQLSEVVLDYLNDLDDKVSVKFHRTLQKHELFFWENNRFSSLGVQEYQKEKGTPAPDVLHFSLNGSLTLGRYASHVKRNQTLEIEMQMTPSQISDAIQKKMMRFYALGSTLFTPKQDEIFFVPRATDFLAGLPMGAIIAEDLFPQLWRGKTFQGPVRLK